MATLDLALSFLGGFALALFLAWLVNRWIRRRESVTSTTALPPPKVNSLGAGRSNGTPNGDRHVGSVVPPAPEPVVASEAVLSGRERNVEISRAGGSSIDLGRGIAPDSGARTRILTEPRAPAAPLAERVLLHIAGQGVPGPYEIAPIGLCQHGMEAQLSVAQSALGKVLRRLVAAGVLSEKSGHVRGQVRRVKVYRLTPVGEALARDLRRQSQRARFAVGTSDRAPR